MRHANRPYSGILAISIIVISSLFALSAYGGSTIYVDDDASAGGDGASWNTAYRFLQDALTSASGGGIAEIHVAQGTYKPDRDEVNPGGNGNREATFYLLNGVALMGGYAGIGAKEPDARDIELFETILSGDLFGNDEEGFINNEENSWHVLTGSGTNKSAVIGGFTVKSGNADDLKEGNGGGIVVFNGSPLIVQCTFVSNSARNAGGAIYLNEGAASVSHCSLIGNAVVGPPIVGTMVGGGAFAAFYSTATISDSLFFENTAGNDKYNGAGGAFAAAFGLNPTLTNCSFINNTSSFWGGAIYNQFTDTTIFDCVFTDNFATVSAGGMYNNENSPSLQGCTFSDNSSLGDGGGIFNEDSRPSLQGCTFSDNSSHGDGGGIYNDDQSNSNLTDCRFDGNIASERGGGMYNHSSSPTITNCLFNSNIAKTWGGAIYNRAGSNPTLINCTLSDNEGSVAGGLFNNDSNPSLVNCILFYNSSPEIADTGSSGTTVTYSNVQGGWPGIGNIDTDPLFIDSENDDYHLSSTSPGIDAADNSAVPTGIETDLDGNPRFVDDPDTKDTGNGDPPIVDMGAYELQVTACPWDLDGSGTVGTGDLLALFTQWGTDGPADFDGSGAVGTGDLLILFANWGPCQ